MNIKKFKTIYLSILIPITVIICIASTWYRAFMFTRDLMTVFKGGDFGDFVTTLSDDLNDAFNNGGININTGIVVGDGVEKEYTGIEFSNIDIDLSMANIEIKEGDTYKVVVEYPEEFMPSVEVVEGTLKISHNNVKNISFNSIGSIDCDVTVYIPKGCQLGAVNVDTDLGNVEIKDSFTYTDVNIVAALGNIEIESMDADVLIIKANLGDVEVKNSSVGELNITADLGDIEVKNCKFSVGNITNDLGEISVSGEFGSLDANCSLGELNVDCDNISEARMDLSADLGEIKVNGKKHGSSYEQ